jgi:hypothetical protein
MKTKLLLCVPLFMTTACSTLNDSMQLGAGMGALTGAAATYTSQSATGKNPESQDVLLGAAIGMGIGMVTSYFTHKKVEENRLTLYQETEMHFGDLPPSPFILPKLPTKKGR